MKWHFYGSRCILLNSQRRTQFLFQVNFFLVFVVWFFLLAHTVRFKLMRHPSQ